MYGKNYLPLSENTVLRLSLTHTDKEAGTNVNTYSDLIGADIAVKSLSKQIQVLWKRYKLTKTSEYCSEIKLVASTHNVRTPASWYLVLKYF